MADWTKRPAAVLDACNATAQDRSARCSKRRRVRIRMEEYEETDILGEGGFGLVLQARHRVTGHTVAIKFPRSKGDKPADASGLLKEARFLDACRGNPYVVASHGLVRDPATANLCLAMEYVGPNLRSFLSERPPLPEAVVRGYMWQLLTGAKKMHERGIVHRDIKPSNILVGGEGGKIVKLCDFGLAMSLATEKTPYGDVGTVPYMAPEMLLGKPGYDARVDTWSLGCVMAEMLTGGNRLFAGVRNDDDEIGQLWAIFRVLGLPDERTWPEFVSLPLANMVPRLFLPPRQHNKLRELFHEEMLSYEGFQVLKGLLECNPDKRLTAAAALQLPWFLHELHTVPSPGKNVLRTKILPRAAGARQEERVVDRDPLSGDNKTEESEAGQDYRTGYDGEEERAADQIHPTGDTQEQEPTGDVEERATDVIVHSCLSQARTTLASDCVKRCTVLLLI